MADYIRARTDEQKEERMSQIKKAADELFKTMPYTEINLSNIAEKLDWSRANLYKYVTTKEEIYLEIVQDRMSEYLQALITVFPEGACFSNETVAEIWTAQIASHEDYFKYTAFLLTIIERNVTVERLTAFKKIYYELADVLKKRLSNTLSVTEDNAENLIFSVMNYASAYFTNCQANPLIAQALKNLNIKPKERNLRSDVKDFILMNIEWMKKKTR
ncbi:TetR/AcrR family transcriptional regulator [Treponema sp.]|uniref:TetR/AcrR family transcriptional regulator n=1 Tax=Treponema sp. TaxID=166 RepID=UPI00389079DF